MIPTLTWSITALPPHPPAPTHTSPPPPPPPPPPDCPFRSLHALDRDDGAALDDQRLADFQVGSLPGDLQPYSDILKDGPGRGRLGKHTGPAEIRGEQKTRAQYLEAPGFQQGNGGM